MGSGDRRALIVVVDPLLAGEQDAGGVIIGTQQVVEESEGVQAGGRQELPCADSTLFTNFGA